jgi:hypothetical protein
MCAKANGDASRKGDSIHCDPLLQWLLRPSYADKYAALHLLARGLLGVSVLEIAAKLPPSPESPFWDELSIPEVVRLISETALGQPQGGDQRVVLLMALDEYPYYAELPENGMLVGSNIISAISEANHNLAKHNGGIVIVPLVAGTMPVNGPSGLTEMDSTYLRVLPLTLESRKILSDVTKFSTLVNNSFIETFLCDVGGNPRFLLEAVAPSMTWSTGDDVENLISRVAKKVMSWRSGGIGFQVAPPMPLWFALAGLQVPIVGSSSLWPTDLECC